MSLKIKSLGRDEHGNLRFRILREPKEKRMDWIHKHKETVQEDQKKPFESNENRKFEIPVFLGKQSIKIFNSQSVSCFSSYNFWSKTRNALSFY